MRTPRRSRAISVIFMQRTAFVRAGAGGRGNKPDLIGILTLSPMIKSGEGTLAMSDDSPLLDHARRYFTQAGQARDIKKMRMLAELGLEFIALAQHGKRPRTHGDAPSASADTPPPSDKGGTGQADS
jgi:hypothetical protein